MRRQCGLGQAAACLDEEASMQVMAGQCPGASYPGWLSGSCTCSFCGGFRAAMGRPGANRCWLGLQGRNGATWYIQHWVQTVAWGLVSVQPHWLHSWSQISGLQGSNGVTWSTAGGLCFMAEMGRPCAAVICGMVGPTELGLRAAWDSAFGRALGGRAAG